MAASEPSPPTLAPGDLVCGDFVVERLVRRGPRGLLYAARARAPSAATGRFEVRVPFTSSAGSPRIFREQMEGLGAVSHRAVAPFAACDVHAVGPVVVTRALTSGMTLRARLDDGSPLALKDVGRIVAEIAAALETFHALGVPVVHRALSPAEVSLGAPSGVVSVGGCGLVHALAAARWLDDAPEDLTDPPYLSPDALLDQVHPRMDTFVLASIAYECLTGAPAFPRAGDHAAILRGAHPRAARARPGLSPAVDEALARAWAPAPDRAFETTIDFAAALSEALRAPRPSLRLAVVTDQWGARGAAATPSSAPPPRLVPALVAPVTGDDDRWSLRAEMLGRRTAEWGVAPATQPPATLDGASGNTISPPESYPAWAGRVSRRNAVLDAPPDPAPSTRAPVAPDDPVAPEARSTPPPVALPVRPARRARAAHGPGPVMLLALTRTASRGAWALSAALLAAAVVVTAGRVYEVRSARAAAPPPAVAAPPVAVTPVTPIALPTAAPPPVAPVAPVAVPPAAPRAVAPAEALAAMQGRLIALVTGCVEAGRREHHVRLHVTYGADGAPTRAAVRGAFAAPPVGRCIERAALSLPLPATARGTASLVFNFVAPIGAPR